MSFTLNRGTELVQCVRAKCCIIGSKDISNTQTFSNISSFIPFNMDAEDAYYDLPPTTIKEVRIYLL